jgi:hypothetical protein
MDHIGTRVEGENTVYVFKTTSFHPSIVEIKSKLMSALDLPVDIPKDIKITEVKHGKLFKEYIVEIVVDKNKIGKLKDLIAKKYGIIRRRPYSGEV